MSREPFSLQELQCWFGIDDGPLFEGLTALVRHYGTKADGLPSVLARVLPKQNKCELGTRRCCHTAGQESDWRQ